MGNVYEFTVNCGDAFSWDDNVLAGLKGKKRERKHESMLEEVETILGKYQMKLNKGYSGFEVTIESEDSRDVVYGKVCEAMTEIEEWYNNLSGTEQKFEVLEK